MRAVKKAEIMDYLIENARILTDDNGNLIQASLEAEIIFECDERGYDDEEAQELVEWAFSHYQTVD